MPNARKEATYTILATNGKNYQWSFYESKDNNDYGNGVYIAIQSPSNDYPYLDCRYYRNYDFDKVCVEWLINYYGENLDELSRND